jgi:hypothetical protein
MSKKNQSKQKLIVESHATSLLESQKKIRKIYPYEIISGEGWGFFMNPETKQIVKITLGKQIMRASEQPDSKGRHLVIAENQYILVPKELIIDIGYN